MEAYKVGITIALTNKISHGLMAISKELGHTDAQALKLKSTLNDIKKMGIAGSIIGGAGLAGLHALGKTLDAAKEYQRALGQFKAIQLGDAVNKDADKFARSSSVIGASATDLMQTLRDLHTALGDYGMAKQLAPQIAQMKFANQAIFGAHGMDFSENQLRSMEKIIEMKGGFHSPADFIKQADMMQKVISSTGGMVKPSDYLQFIKTAGLSGRLLSNESFYYAMEPLIQEMTGNRVGTATMSSYNNLAQGRSTVRAANEMMRLGLLDPKMVEWTKIGTVKQIKPGALKDMDRFTSNPYDWMKETFLPQLAKHGITAEKDILNEMGAIWGNRTGSNLFSLMYLQQEKIEKNMAISKGAMDTRQLYKLALTTPDGVEMALGAAWKNLKIAMGEVLWPVIIPGINKFAEVLRDIGKWINQHPVKFDFIVKTVAGLSAIAALGGSLLIAGAGLKLMGVALTAVTGLQLAGAASGMKLLAGALGPLVAIALAIANSEGIGRLVSGTWAETLNPFLAVQRGTEAATRWMLEPSNAPGLDTPPSRSQEPTKHFKFYLDGRPLQARVNELNDRDARRPSSSGSGADYRALPHHAGASGGW